MTTRAFTELWLTELSGFYDEREIRELLRVWLEDRVHVNRLEWMTMEEIPSEWEYRDDLNRMSEGEPIQYVIGEALFCDLKFNVNSNVLIPRPETEDLVRLLVEHCSPSAKVLDIGSGSGCIPISLKYFRSDLDVTSVDISAEALKVAQSNASRHGVECHFEPLDILKDWPLELYDVIVSNPPYIEEHEKSSMSSHVLNYEPELALFVPNANPLLFYNRIAQKALETCSQLWFECHVEHARKVGDMMTSLGYFEVQLHPDITGRMRFVSGRIK